MNDNSPSKLTIIIVGVLALLMIAILPIAPSLFRSTAPTLTFSPLQVDDPLTQLSGDSIEQLFERDTVADLTLTLDTPIVELNNLTLREVFEENNFTSGNFANWDYERLEQAPYVDSNGYTILETDHENILDTWWISKDIDRNIFYNKNVYINWYDYFVNYTSSSSDRQIGIPTTYSNFYENEKTKIVKFMGELSALYIRGNQGTNRNISILGIKTLVVIPIEYLGIGALTTSELDYYYSLYQELLVLDGGLPAQYSNGVYTNDEVMIYVTPLITAGQYSPLFDSTFDVMTDADIEDQLDDWLARGFNYPQLTYELTEAQLLYFATLNQELIDLDGGLPNTITYEIFTSNNLIVDLVPLKTNHQYSPLYMKTFDVMTDAEIIAQMNAWHYENLLP